MYFSALQRIHTRYKSDNGMTALKFEVSVIPCPKSNPIPIKTANDPINQIKMLIKISCV